MINGSVEIKRGVVTGRGVKIRMCGGQNREWWTEEGVVVRGGSGGQRRVWWSEGVVLQL